MRIKLLKGGNIMLSNLTVHEFIKELASNSPAPGGGSVAALAASIGSALSCMVFNLTIGKKSYNEYDDNTKNMILDSLKKSDSSKEEFLALMEKDVEEFLQLMDAFKLPKASEEEKVIRSKKIEEGYLKALQVPFEVAKKAYSIYDYVLVACKYGNKNAVSDAGVAALMLQTAIESAILNVKINLSSIDDEEYNRNTKQQCDELIESGNKKKKEIMDIVNSKL
jgi:formiminotetrahydrofolate cyclodeaminase